MEPICIYLASREPSAFIIGANELAGEMAIYVLILSRQRLAYRSYTQDAKIIIISFACKK